MTLAAETRPTKIAEDAVLLNPAPTDKYYIGCLSPAQQRVLAGTVGRLPIRHLPGDRLTRLALEQRLQPGIVLAGRHSSLRLETPDGREAHNIEVWVGTGSVVMGDGDVRHQWPRFGVEVSKFWLDPDRDEQHVEVARINLLSGLVRLSSESPEPPNDRAVADTAYWLAMGAMGSYLVQLDLEPELRQTALPGILTGFEDIMNQVGDESSQALAV